MAVRAKFYVTEVAQTTGGGRVKLAAVCRGEDNKVWSSATPWGTLEMGVKNELALEQFEVGSEVFLDITPAPKGQEGMG